MKSKVYSVFCFFVIVLLLMLLFLTGFCAVLIFRDGRVRVETMLSLSMGVVSVLNVLC